MRTSDDFDYLRERFADEIAEDRAEKKFRRALSKPYFERSPEDDKVIDEWVKDHVSNED